MKGNEKIIAALNEILADELTAISQYMVHSEMCANFGYERLHKATEHRAIQEMKHAEKLIARLLFLEGKPAVNRLNPIHIGEDVPTQLKNDREAERAAIEMYNKAVILASQLSDEGTRELLSSNLEDEEQHIDWLEAQLDQLEQIGAQNYLAAQVRTDKE